jgi:Flp pilus assembly pilin Flp
MQQLFSKFRKTESGAVTVEWVVLSALAVTLLAAGYGSMRDGATTLADGTGSFMSDYR